MFFHGDEYTTKIRLCQEGGVERGIDKAQEKWYKGTKELRDGFNGQA